MIIPLGILCLIHWVVLFRTMFIVRATWNDSVGACVVTQTDPGLLNVTYFLSKYEHRKTMYTILTMSSNGFRLCYHAGDRNRPTKKAHCAYGSLETSIPGWPGLSYSYFYEQLCASGRL